MDKKQKQHTKGRGKTSPSFFILMELTDEDMVGWDLDQ